LSVLAVLGGMLRPAFAARAANLDLRSSAMVFCVVS
jgi:hypothetical protein